RTGPVADPGGRPRRSRMEGAPDPRSRHRQLAEPDAGCRSHGVRDRRRARDHWRLADALRTRRAVRRGDLDARRLGAADILSAREGIVEERPGQELAVRVVDELLVRRPTDALDGRAVLLPDDERRVEHAADVLDDVVGEDPDVAGLAIHPDAYHVSRHR